MYDQPLTKDHYLLHRLNTFSKTEVLTAIEILQRRLSFLESDEYYLHIPVTELPIPDRIKTVMHERQIYSVKELLLIDPDQLANLRGVGVKHHAFLKKLLANIEQQKDRLKGLTGEELRQALSEL